VSQAREANAKFRKSKLHQDRLLPLVAFGHNESYDATKQQKAFQLI
jgi:hypothetical protein